MNDFNSIAPFYNFLEKIGFGDYLQNIRKSYLYNIENKEILLIGEGTGKLLTYFLSLPTSCITIVDSSSEMCEILKGLNLNQRKKISIINQSFLDFNIDKYYDFVSTCFFLDCFSQIDSDLCRDKITNLLKSGGFWFDVDFYDPKNCSFSGYYFKFVMKILFCFFRKSTHLGSHSLPCCPQRFCKNFVLRNKSICLSPPLNANLREKVGT